MPDIFDEIEEEVRAERLRHLLSRYAGLILIAVLLIVAAVAGWRLWGSYQTRRDQRAAVLYLTAVNQVRTPGDAGKETRLAGQSELVQLAKTAPPGYRALARLRAAALLEQDGKTAEALAMYNALATDSSAGPLLRQLATLLWAERQIDTGDPQSLEARLKPLAAPDSPWRALAERELALLDMRRNKPEAARATLQGLATDATAPVGVRESAQLLLQQMEGTR